MLVSLLLFVADFTTSIILWSVSIAIMVIPIVYFADGIQVIYVSEIGLEQDYFELDGFEIAENEEYERWKPDILSISKFFIREYEGVAKEYGELVWRGLVGGNSADRESLEKLAQVPVSASFLTLSKADPDLLKPKLYFIALSLHYDAAMFTANLPASALVTSAISDALIPYSPDRVACS